MQWKKYLAGLLITLLCLTKGVTGFASHIFGGELLYTCINDTTYKLSLTFYGDCSAFAPVFHSLDTAHPLIYVYNNGVFTDSLRLHADSTEIDVSPVCPRELDSTTCHNGTLPGVKKFVYSDTIVLHTQSAKWAFIFKGDMGASNAAGRSVNITNIVSPGTSLIQLEADLNNTIGRNSSPEYFTVPTPFYCINVPEEYNQGAIDPDGDSLAFKLVQAYDGHTGSPVTYNFPFTATTPMGTTPGNFNFTNVNGQVTFIPDITQDALIVTQVSEYRGNVLAGSSEREMTFIISNNCFGTPPSLQITSIYGGVAHNNIINLCEGTPQLSFILSLTNPEGDSTRITYHNLPPGAILDTFDNFTPNPSASFSWNTSAVAPGLYTFYVTLQNNHCPIANTQTIAYTINIATPPTITAMQVYPTDCIHQAVVEYDMTAGFLPRNVFVVSGVDTIRTYADTTGMIRDSLPAGTYTVIVSSDSLCTAAYTFTIADSGTIPLLPFFKFYCQGDVAAPLYTDPVGPTATIAWYEANGIPLPAAPTPATNVPGVYTWYFIEQYKVCTSLPDTGKVIVRAAPDIDLPDPNISLCFGDTLYLTADGGATYSWYPTEELRPNSAGQLYTLALYPETFTVTAVDQFGCKDTTTRKYDNIQQCCSFVYPTAFTPNNDGLNDGFRIVTYGNMARYQLYIYDRWGNKVFYTDDPKQYWDGTYLGIPCDMDTYYYYFNGQCLTGRGEQHKGDVTLIR